MNKVSYQERVESRPIKTLLTLLTVSIWGELRRKKIRFGSSASFPVRLVLQYNLFETAWPKNTLLTQLSLFSHFGRRVQLEKIKSGTSKLISCYIRSPFFFLFFSFLLYFFAFNFSHLISCGFLAAYLLDFFFFQQKTFFLFPFFPFFFSLFSSLSFQIWGLIESLASKN